MHNIQAQLYKIKRELKEGYLYTEVFFGILAEVVQQLGSFARKLVKVRGGLADVVIQSLVREDLSKGALARLSVAKNIFQPRRGCIESGQCVAGLDV